MCCGVKKKKKKKRKEKFQTLRTRKSKKQKSIARFRFDSVHSPHVKKKDEREMAATPDKVSIEENKTHSFFST